MLGVALHGVSRLCPAVGLIAIRFIVEVEFRSFADHDRLVRRQLALVKLVARHDHASNIHIWYAVTLGASSHGRAPFAEIAEVGR